jgi:NAD(P)-dependent dehydrogenase (short-subunit alcohol dehydrogenase family)
LQYAGDGILVNAVAPGSIDTPRQVGNRQREAEVTGKSIEEIRQARVKDIPLGRLGRPEAEVERVNGVEDIVGCAARSVHSHGKV